MFQKLKLLSSFPCGPIETMNDREHLIQCLTEEAIEVALELGKIGSKCNRFGVTDINVKDPTGPTNQERLVDELNDLIAVANLLAANGALPPNWENKAKQKRKMAKVAHYMQYAEKTGALEKV